MRILDKIKLELRAITRGTIFGLGLGGAGAVAGLVAGAAFSAVFPVATIPTLLIAGAIGASSLGFIGINAGYSSVKDEHNNKILNDNISKSTNKDKTNNVEKKRVLRLQPEKPHEVKKEVMHSFSESTKSNMPVTNLEQSFENSKNTQRIKTPINTKLTNSTVNKTPSKPWQHKKTNSALIKQILNDFNNPDGIIKRPNNEPQQPQKQIQNSKSKTVNQKNQRSLT